MKLVASYILEFAVNVIYSVRFDVKDEVLVLARSVPHDLIQIHSDVVTGHVESADRKRKPLEL